MEITLFYNTDLRFGKSFCCKPNHNWNLSVKVKLWGVINGTYTTIEPSPVNVRVCYSHWQHFRAVDFAITKDLPRALCVKSGIRLIKEYMKYLESSDPSLVNWALLLHSQSYTFMMFVFVTDPLEMQHGVASAAASSSDRVVPDDGAPTPAPSAAPLPIRVPAAPTVPAPRRITRSALAFAFFDTPAASDAIPTPGAAAFAAYRGRSVRGGGRTDRILVRLLRTGLSHLSEAHVHHAVRYRREHLRGDQRSGGQAGPAATATSTSAAAAAAFEPSFQVFAGTERRRRRGKSLCISYIKPWKGFACRGLFSFSGYFWILPYYIVYVLV